MTILGIHFSAKIDIYEEIFDGFSPLNRAFSTLESALNFASCIRLLHQTEAV